MQLINKLLLISLFLLVITTKAQDKWTVPKEFSEISNPLPNSVENITTGQKLFQSLCTACHGVNGKGDGVAAAGLNPKPTDFTSKTFQEQSDGAVFWKLSKGKGVMASYEGMISENDRWALVSYLKSLKVSEMSSNESVGNEDNEYVKNTFLFTQLINTQTVQVLPKRSSEFTIQHRFGATAFNSNFIDDFLGMDLSSNIRFAYAMALNDRVYAEIGRSKYGKVYDINFKYLLLRQTISKKNPLSIAFFGDLGIMTDKFPNLVDGSTFSDGSDFSYSFTHRLSYNMQLIIARKFSENFSLQINPTFIWRNLVPIDDENLVVAFPIGSRIRLNHKSAILFEITPTVFANINKFPISLAYEIASSSAHSFQIIASSTDRILESAIYTQEGYNYTDGQFVLGFNIKRIF